MRITKTLLLSAVIAISSAFVSLAGEWKQDDTGWWYQNDDGSYPANQWQSIDGVEYHFDGTGYLSANIIAEDGRKVDASGKLMVEYQNTVNSGEYEEAVFDKFNSFASLNGHSGTKVYVKGTAEEKIVTDNTSYAIRLKDKNGDSWIIACGVEPEIDCSFVNELIGKEVTVFG